MRLHAHGHSCEQQGGAQRHVHACRAIFPMRLLCLRITHSASARTRAGIKMSNKEILEVVAEVDRDGTGASLVLLPHPDIGMVRGEVEAQDGAGRCCMG